MVGSWTNYQKKSSAYWLSSMVVCCRVFSHDVTAAMLVFQNNKTAAMLVSQTNPVGIELFSYVNAFFCSCWPREWIPGILRFSPASKTMFITDSKQLLEEVFVISGLTKVDVNVISGAEGRGW